MQKKQLAEAKALEEKQQKERQIQEQKKRAEVLRQEAEKALQMQLQEDMSASQVQAEIAEFYPKIIARIQQNWRRDPNVGLGLSCLIQVRIGAMGQVLEAVVLKSSGNAIFDRSAEMAVLRSSPLPLPDGEGARQELLRGFNFLFKPEDA